MPIIHRPLKSIYGLVLFAGLISFELKSRAVAQVVILQPGPSDGKDIWTTSTYSYTSDGISTPGGGLANDQLRVGGFGDEYDSLLQFNLSGLPQVASSVTLSLYDDNSGSGSPVSMNLAAITQPWDWTTMGTGRDHDRLWWADRPNTSVLPIGLNAPTPGSWENIDITNLYNSWQNGTTPNYGVELQPTGINNQFNIFDSSRYMGDPTLRPKLTITLAPVPTQAPSAGSFPSPTDLYTPTLTTFVQNHGSEFSAPTQQFLLSNVTAQSVQANAAWKKAAVVAGTGLQVTSKTIDVILASQSGSDLAQYLAISLLPAKYQNYASGATIAASLASDIATENEIKLTIDLIGADSYLYGNFVAPQMISLGQDPFDPNYKDPVVVTGFPALSISETGDSLTIALSREFNDQTHAANYLQAANAAYNRYSSALESSDGISAGLQLQSLYSYLALYRSAIASDLTDSAEINRLLPTSGIGDLAYDPQSFSDLQSQIRENGLPTSTLSLLQGLGLSQDDINEVTENILVMDPNSFSGSLYGALSAAQEDINVPEPSPSSLVFTAVIILAVWRHRRQKVSFSQE